MKFDINSKFQVQDFSSSASRDWQFQKRENLGKKRGNPHYAIFRAGYIPWFTVYKLKREDFYNVIKDKESDL